MNKIWVIVTIARQYDGDIVSVRFDKSYTKKELAEVYLSTLSKKFAETINVPGIGAVEFFCERGIHEIDITE